MGQPAILDEPSLDKNDELYHTDIGVGEILRRTRVHYGQSLEDIEVALRIKAIQISAIETGCVENLPGRVYAIGFVRSYSEYLGLDGDKMVGLFKAQSSGKAVVPALDFPVAASETKIPPLWLVGLSLLLGVFIIAGWWTSQSRDRTNVTEIPSVPDEMKIGFGSEDVDIDAFVDMSANVQIPTDGGMEDAAQQGDASAQAVDGAAVSGSNPGATTVTPEIAAAPPAPKGILLNILKNSWVEIKDQNGKALVSRVLKAGDQYFVPDRPELSMSLGNAGGVQVQIDGQILRPLGEPGQVKRGIALDATTLKSQYSNPQEPKIIENIVE